MAKKLKKPHPVIVVEHVKKMYTLRHEKPTFVEKIIGLSREERFLALNDVTFTVNKGERIGIFGPNGSGKTTLLKIISGITLPSEGTLKVKGRVVSLIDLAAGFHPDLSGQDNIFLNGLILGMTRSQIGDKFSQIVEYADIGDFIDAPLFTYSEGMKLRLGFSIAIHANPDILILDEGISVGDENFQKKSFSTIKKLFRTGVTVLVVMHWLERLEQLCDRIMVFENGRIKNIYQPRNSDS